MNYLNLLSRMHLDDWVVYLQRVITPLCLLSFGTFTLLLGARRMCTSPWRLRVYSLILAVAVGGFLVAGRRQIAITLLGAEDDLAAEEAFSALAREGGSSFLLKELERAISRSDVNAAFYLCKLIGERIGSGEDSSLKDSVDQLPPLKINGTPRFFTRTELNAKLHVREMPTDVRDLIIYFLEDFRRGESRVQ